VIGRGGEERNPHAWGWYVYDADDYRRLDESELVTRIEIDPRAKVEVHRADADGVSPIRREQA